MNDERLREKIIEALEPSDGLVLMELCGRIAVDSRRLQAMLHAMGAQRIVRCKRENGRLIWVMHEEFDADTVPAPAPPPKPAPSPPIQSGAKRGDWQRGISMAERQEHSVRAKVLQHILQQTSMVRSGAVVDALRLPQKQVNNQLTMLVREGRIARVGERGSFVYGPKNLAAPPAEPRESAPAAAQAPPAAPPQRFSLGDVALQFSVPVAKVSAVIRAVEQALAA